jgi:hypothetical protein
MPAGFRILLTAALYRRGNRGSAPKAPAGVSNRVGSPPTQPGGLLWLMGRPSFAVVFATEASSRVGPPDWRISPSVIFCSRCMNTTRPEPRF